MAIAAPDRTRYLLDEDRIPRAWYNIAADLPSPPPPPLHPGTGQPIGPGDLASLFRTRIELRQIGVRDEAARLSGVGRCGREYCCSTWLTELSPASQAN